MWHTSDELAMGAWVQSKHIFVGETRIATKFNIAGNQNTQAEQQSVYFYHTDHLGSAQTITNWQGVIHERLEYTPYGELWIDWRAPGALHATPFRFTGHEHDRETGLIYAGARYMDPRTSRWLSTDPAMWEGDFIPGAPVSDAARQRNENLPGQGGVFNVINLHVFNYGANNPIRYVDPDGRFNIQAGFGWGPAIRMRVQFHEGRITTSVQVGVGIGGEFRISPIGRQEELGSSLSVGVEASIGAKLHPHFSGGFAAEVSYDNRGNFTNQAELSVTHTPTGHKAGVKVNHGRLGRIMGQSDSHDFVPTGFGGSAMLFVGVGLENTIER